MTYNSILYFSRQRMFNLAHSVFVYWYSCIVIVLMYWYIKTILIYITYSPGLILPIIFLKSLIYRICDHPLHVRTTEHTAMHIINFATLLTVVWQWGPLGNVTNNFILLNNGIMTTRLVTCWFRLLNNQTVPMKFCQDLTL